MKNTVLLGLLGAFFLAGNNVSADEKDVPKLNKAVLKFAEDHVDKQVGNGECWTLIDEALAAAKAKRPDPKQQWVFGKEVTFDDLLPGDIMAESFPGGRHAAIIARVEGKKLDLVQQNVSGVKKVVRSSGWDPSEAKKSEIHYYRPVGR